MQKYLEAIQRLKPRLNCLAKDPLAGRSYRPFLDALVWVDETPSKPIVDHDEDLVFPCLLSYRTRVLMGEDTPEFVPYLNHAKITFPEWPGFSEDRWMPNSDLVTEIRKGREDDDLLTAGWYSDEE